MRIEVTGLPKGVDPKSFKELMLKAVCDSEVVAGTPLQVDVTHSVTAAKPEDAIIYEMVSYAVRKNLLTVDEEDEDDDDDVIECEYEGKIYLLTVSERTPAAKTKKLPYRTKEERKNTDTLQTAEKVKELLEKYYGHEEGNYNTAYTFPDGDSVQMIIQKGGLVNVDASIAASDTPLSNKFMDAVAEVIRYTKSVERNAIQVGVTPNECYTLVVHEGWLATTTSFPFVLNPDTGVGNAAFGDNQLVAGREMIKGMIEGVLDTWVSSLNIMVSSNKERTRGTTEHLNNLTRSIMNQVDIMIMEGLPSIPAPNIRFGNRSAGVPRISMKMIAAMNYVMVDMSKVRHILSQQLTGTKLDSDRITGLIVSDACVSGNENNVLLDSSRVTLFNAQDKFRTLMLGWLKGKANGDNVRLPKIEIFSTPEQVFEQVFKFLQEAGLSPEVNVSLQQYVQQRWGVDATLTPLDDMPRVEVLALLWRVNNQVSQLLVSRKHVFSSDGTYTKLKMDVQRIMDDALTLQFGIPPHLDPEMKPDLMQFGDAMWDAVMEHLSKYSGMFGGYNTQFTVCRNEMKEVLQGVFGQFGLMKDTEDKEQDDTSSKVDYTLAKYSRLVELLLQDDDGILSIDDAQELSTLKMYYIYMTGTTMPLKHFDCERRHINPKLDQAIADTVTDWAKELTITKAPPREHSNYVQNLIHRLLMLTSTKSDDTVKESMDKAMATGMIISVTKSFPQEVVNEIVDELWKGVNRLVLSIDDTFKNESSRGVLWDQLNKVFDNVLVEYAITINETDVPSFKNKAQEEPLTASKVYMNIFKTLPPDFALSGMQWETLRTAIFAGLEKGLPEQNSMVRRKSPIGMYVEICELFKAWRARDIQKHHNNLKDALLYFEQKVAEIVGHKIE